MKRDRPVIAAALCGILPTLVNNAAARNRPPLSKYSPQTQAEAAASADAAPCKTPDGAAVEIEALRRRLVHNRVNIFIQYKYRQPGELR